MKASGHSPRLITTSVACRVLPHGFIRKRVGKTNLQIALAEKHANRDGLELKVPTDTEQSSPWIQQPAAEDLQDFVHPVSIEDVRDGSS